MIGAEMSARIAYEESQRAAVVASLVLGASIMLFLAGLFGARPIVALAMLFGMNICTGAMQPLITSWFNEQIESSNRATLLSFNSTIATMGGAVGLLVFFAFALQCMSTIAVVRRETGGWRWPAAQFAYMTGMAYVCAFLTNHVVAMWS